MNFCQQMDVIFDPARLEDRRFVISCRSADIRKEFASPVVGEQPVSKFRTEYDVDQEAVVS